MTYQFDLFGVPWLGTILIVVGVVVVGFLAIVAGKTVRQLREGKADPEAPVAKAVEQDTPTNPGKVHRQAPAKKDPSPVSQPKPKYNNYKDIHSPLGANGMPTFFNRVSPLFYEESKDGKWKVSLGRVAFWPVLMAFIGMCVSVETSLNTSKAIDPNLPTLYLGVISLLFLTLLGLLGYNLGSKFTDPMTKFLLIWIQNKGGASLPVVPAAPAATTTPVAPTTPATPEAPATETAPTPNLAGQEEGMPSATEDPEAG